MEAFNLAQVDKQYEMHMQAWLSHQVTATNKKGSKPLFSNFKDFFDYEKALEQLQGSTGLSDEHKRLGKIAKKVNERR